LAPASAAVIEREPEVIGVNGVCGIVVIGVVPGDVPGVVGVVPGPGVWAMQAPRNSNEAIETPSGAGRIEVMVNSW
jgi:hypothetical protein